MVWAEALVGENGIGFSILSRLEGAWLDPSTWAVLYLRFISSIYSVEPEGTGDYWPAVEKTLCVFARFLVQQIT